MSILKLLKPTLILIAFVILSPIYSILISQSSSAVGYATNITVGDLNSLSNQVRANAGLASLNLNAQLSSAAYAKANDMFVDNYWAHVAPDGTQAWSFILAAGYSYTTAGENLAKDFSTSSGVVTGWMGSASHAANVLNSLYKDVGYAVVNGTLFGSETTLVVAMYGAGSEPEPAPAPVVVSTSPSSTQTGNTQVVATVPETMKATQATAEETPKVTEIVATETKTAENTKTNTRKSDNKTVSKTPKATIGSVAGAVITSPTNFYKSLNKWLKLSILITSIILLVVAVLYILMNRKDKYGYKYIWFKKQPIASSAILVILVTLTTISSIGIAL